MGKPHIHYQTHRRMKVSSMISGIGKSPSGWIVSQPPDWRKFLRALAKLVPDNSTFAVEGCGSPPDEVADFFRARAPQQRISITSWKTWKLPATPANLNGLADVDKYYESSHGSIQISVVHGKQRLLFAHDAFLWPFWISKQIPEEKVAAFCRELGITFGEH